jgi:hypothetical protein
VCVCENEKIETNLGVTGCEDVKWDVLGQGYITKWEFVFKVLGILVLVSGNSFVWQLTN